MISFWILIGIGVAFLTGAGVLFYFLLKPIKNNQARFEKRLDRIEYKIDKIVKKTKA